MNHLKTDALNCGSSSQIINQCWSDILQLVACGPRTDYLSNPLTLPKAQMTYSLSVSVPLSVPLSVSVSVSVSVSPSLSLSLSLSLRATIGTLHSYLLENLRFLHSTCVRSSSIFLNAHHSPKISQRPMSDAQASACEGGTCYGQPREQVAAGQVRIKPGDGKIMWPKVTWWLCEYRGLVHNVLFLWSENTEDWHAWARVYVLWSNVNIQDVHMLVLAAHMCM